MRGLFVTFEGIDRSGKTTQAGLLVDALGDAALGVREPGGTPAGERLRELLKDAEIDWRPRPRRCCSRRLAPSSWRT